MAEITEHSGSPYFRELPVAAIVYSNLLSARLGMSTSTARLKKYASTGLTVFLVTVSLFGLFQIASLILPELLSDNPKAPAAAKTTAAATPPKQAAAPAAASLPKSSPTYIDIPAIGVSAGVVEVGLDEKGAMEVPDADVAGWYNLGPSPGETGPAIINGHVDSAISGPAIFWSLDKLKAGDEVKISRADGKTVTFVVEKAEVYDQNNFPTQTVYGNLDYAGLRLITCEGDFDYVTRHYSHNLVVYAKAVL